MEKRWKMSEILIELLLEICALLFSSVILITWYSTFCRRKEEREKFIWSIICFVIISLVLERSLNNLLKKYFIEREVAWEVIEWVQYAMEIAAEWLLFVRKYKGSFKRKLLVYLPYIFIIPTIEVYILSVLNRDLLSARVNNYYLESTNNITLLIAMYLVILIVSEIHRSIKSKENSHHIVPFIVILITQLILHFFVEKIFLTTTNENNMNLLLIWYCLSALMILCVARIHKIVLDDLEYVRFDNERQRNWKQQIDYYQATSKTTAELKRIEHDSKKHLVVIEQLAQIGKIDELRDYVRDVIKHTSPKIKIVDVGNPIISAILTLMEARYKENNIRFQHRVEYKQIAVKDFDISSILGNIMDNAFEASVQEIDVSKRFIQLSILADRGSVLISCHNHYLGEIVMEGQEIKTSKADKYNHGIGITNIKKTAEKYNGKVEIKMDGQIFGIHVTLHENA